MLKLNHLPAPFTERFKNLPSWNMIKVEGGSFRMGSEDYEDEKPIHEVKLSSFYIGQFPVTQALWEAVMGIAGNRSRFIGKHRPVERVSWKDTQAFLKELNRRTLRNYRLPTEAEWEYAARGGQLSQGYLYAGSNDLEEVGWFTKNSHSETKYVGQKFPNELGLYDMSGNVDEWCSDYYSASYYASCASKGLVENPIGPTKGTNRVIRGGSWINDAQFCRATLRGHWFPVNRLNDIGFRLVFSL